MGRLGYRVLLIALLALLHGCATSKLPVSHVQLSAGDTQPGSSPTPRVMVDAIEVPDVLLRHEMLVREDEYSLRYDASKRWAEPLDVGVQRVIARRLTSVLDSYGVKSFPTARSRDLDWRVDISLINFEVIGNDVVLVADVYLHPGDGGQARSQRFAARRALRASDGAVIAAQLSELLGELVDSIAAQMR
jgi:uncharacterized lipoprotein YmbA